MLHIGNIIYDRIVDVPTICTTDADNSKMLSCNNDTECDNDTNDTQDFIKRVNKAVLISFIDAVLIGGITFFSSMAAIGYDNLLVNVKIAFISSVVTAGLSFFTEIRDKISDTNKKNMVI
jgi:hypothetical protein